MMFPDSNALAPALNVKVIDTCSDSPFTIMCDGGNDQADKKYFGIIIRHWKKDARQAVTMFLCYAYFESHAIARENVKGYVSDTASGMVGKHTPVLRSHLQKQLKHYSPGCICHLLALCASSSLNDFYSISDTYQPTFYTNNNV